MGGDAPLLLNGVEECTTFSKKSKTSTESRLNLVKLLKNDIYLPDSAEVLVDLTILEIGREDHF